MTEKNKSLLKAALENAAEMIRSHTDKPRTEINAGFPGTMKKRGAPIKPEQDKIKSVTPGLRVEVGKWAAISAKYPRQINKMFNDWLNTL